MQSTGISSEDWLQNDNLSQNVISIRLSKNAILFISGAKVKYPHELYLRTKLQLYKGSKIYAIYLISLIYIPICIGITLECIIDNIVTISHHILSITTLKLTIVCTIVIIIASIFHSLGSSDYAHIT